ncbi:MAG: calcium-binding protein [Leptolyngbyaceae cyanobacterium RM1_1_2]|nr:calcium-binding protein [Leptolyngbyaceae cyanobacterium RM1_1_2]
MENCQRQRAPRIPGRRNADSVSTHRQHWCLNPSDSSQRQHRIWQVFASQYNNYGPEKVRLPDNSKVDFFATSPPRSAENIIGTEERDNLDGTLGNDIIRGLGGSDLLVGEPFGTSGNVGGRDQIFGGAGDDLIAGRGGNDILMGQKGNDIIYGDGGDDILNGGEGNNTLIGDALDASIGADVFVLQRGGFATIKDFQLGIDRIGLYNRLNSSSNLVFSDLLITQSAADPSDTLIIGRGELVDELENVLASRLSASSFIQVTDDYVQARIPA